MPKCSVNGKMYLRQDSVAVSVMQLEQPRGEGLRCQRRIHGELQDGCAVCAMRKPLEPAGAAVTLTCTGEASLLSSTVRIALAASKPTRCSRAADGCDGDHSGQEQHLRCTRSTSRRVMPCDAGRPLALPMPRLRGLCSQDNSIMRVSRV